MIFAKIKCNNCSYINTIYVGKNKIYIGKYMCPQDSNSEKKLICQKCKKSLDILDIFSDKNMNIKYKGGLINDTVSK